MTALDEVDPAAEGDEEADEGADVGVAGPLSTCAWAVTELLAKLLSSAIMGLTLREFLTRLPRSWELFGERESRRRPRYARLLMAALAERPP